MEAFILTDKVIARQHMTQQYQRPRYLKKYDLPSYASKDRTRTCTHRKPLTPLACISAPRTKDLLAYISQPVDVLNQSLSSPHKIDKYFTLTSEPFRQSSRKNKVGLLVKTIQPNSQHYDAEFATVSKRAPCWKFLPVKKNKKQNENIPQPEKSNVEAKHKQRPPKPRPFEFGQFLEKQEQKISLQTRSRQEVDTRLQYNISQLGKCTVQIFKKYNLDKDVYFKRMLAGLEK